MHAELGFPQLFSNLYSGIEKLDKAALGRAETAARAPSSAADTPKAATTCLRATTIVDEESASKGKRSLAKATAAYGSIRLC